MSTVFPDVPGTTGNADNKDEMVTGKHEEDARVQQEQEAVVETVVGTVEAVGAVADALAPTKDEHCCCSFAKLCVILCVCVGAVVLIITLLVLYFKGELNTAASQEEGFTSCIDQCKEPDDKCDDFKCIAYCNNDFDWKVKENKADCESNGGACTSLDCSAALKLAASHPAQLIILVASSALQLLYFHI